MAPLEVIKRRSFPHLLGNEIHFLTGKEIPSANMETILRLSMLCYA